MRPGLVAAALLLGGVIRSAAVARALLDYAYSVAAGDLLQMKLATELRTSVFDKLQTAQLSLLRPERAIFNRVTGDVQSVRSFVDGVHLPGAILDDATT